MNADTAWLLEAEEPEAYKAGWQPFLGLRIYLDSHPLIPRPETEYWTERLLAHVGTYDVPTLKFLDLCAGSGAIGCAALARLPGAEVYFGEVDPAHEATILKNIRENGQGGTRAHIHIGDLFEPFGDLKFDVIAINPPYIPDDRALPASVTKYEPALALRAGSDGLDLIRRIAAELPRRLTAHGQAWVECDSPTAETARTLFEAQGFAAEIRTDQYGAPRLLVVTLKQ